jgi:hypothetical protein
MAIAVPVQILTSGAIDCALVVNRRSPCAGGGLRL